MNDDTVQWLVERSMLEQARAGGAALRRPGPHVATRLRRGAPARCGRAGLGLVLSLSGVGHHAAGRVGAADAGRPGAVAGLCRDRHPGAAHGPHETGRRAGVADARLHADHRRPLRPHRPGHRSGLRHGRGVCGHEPPRRRAMARPSSTTSCPATRARDPTFAWPRWATATIPGSTTWWRSTRRTGACCPQVGGRTQTRPTCRRRRWTRCTNGLHRGPALPRHLLRAGRQGDQLERHRRRCTGVDGVTRRWVYLHYFKEGQPTLNWLDPSFAAPRMVHGRRAAFAGHAGRGHAAPGRQRLSRRGGARRTGRPGRKGIRSRSRPTS